METNAGKKWPWIIGFSIVGVVIACVITIKVALNNPVEQSDYGMQNYHEYDANVNQIIEAKIAFDKKYKIEFKTEQIAEKDTVISYTVEGPDGNPINDANVSVVLTRPDTTKNNIELNNPTITNGTYTFNPVDLPKAGRWDILAKISVGENHRYYNLKADTRNSNTFEF